MQIKLSVFIIIASLTVLYSGDTVADEPVSGPNYENRSLPDTRSGSNAIADRAAELDAREQQRQQERERLLHQQNNPAVDTRIQQPDLSLPDYPHNEQPCFTISSIRLGGESVSDFQWVLKAV